MTVRYRRAALLPAAAVALLLAALAMLAGCSGAGTVAGKNGTVNAVASTNVWGSVLRAVGGNAVSVRSLIDSPDKDPHDYESTPQDGLAISRAQLVVYNGGGYDTFFTDALNANASTAKRVDAYGISGKKQQGEENEHVFYDLDTVAKVADKIGAELGALKPERKQYFAANAKAFVNRLNPLRTLAKRIGAQHSGATALVTEPVADYLLATAGIQDKTPKAFAEAVEHDIDVPAKALADSLALLSGKKVNLLVNNAQTETDTTNQLLETAKKAGVPVINVTETLPAGTTDYDAWIGGTIRQMSAALGTGA